MPLELVKTILAGAAVLLAVFQAVVMLQVRGKLSLLPIKVRDLIRLHKWGGRASLALVTLIGLLCLYVVFGLGYPLYSAHVRTHALLGAGAGMVLLAKVVVANRRRALLRHSLFLGMTAAVLLAGAFGASGLIYLIAIL